MRIKQITGEDVVADAAKQAIETSKKREASIKNAGQRAADASKKLTQNLRQNAAASKSRDKHRDELKKMATEGESDIADDIECIKADMDGRLNNTPPRRRKKAKKI